MYNDQGSNQTAANQQFEKGTPVYDVNGDKVGAVSEHGVQDGSLVVHHGLFRDDVYIPLSVITSNTPDGVTLSVSKEDVLEGRWPDATERGASVSTIAAGSPTDQATPGAGTPTDQATTQVDVVQETSEAPAAGAGTAGTAQTDTAAQRGTTGQSGPTS